jgi:hypothetical protein
MASKKPFRLRTVLRYKRWKNGYKASSPASRRRSQRPRLYVCNSASSAKVVSPCCV